MVPDHRAGPVRAPGRGVPEHFHHIGIRIEDDAVVTDTRLRAAHARRARGWPRLKR